MFNVIHAIYITCMFFVLFFCFLTSNLFSDLSVLGRWNPGLRLLCLRPRLRARRALRAVVQTATPRAPSTARRGTSTVLDGVKFVILPKQ